MNEIKPVQTSRISRADNDSMLIHSWLRTKASPGTRKTYALHIDYFMWWRSVSLRALTVDDLLDYKDHLALTRQAIATQALRLNALKSLLNYGHRIGYLAFDVGKAVPSPKVPRMLAERILPEWQVMALLNHKDLGLRDRVLLRLLYASGGRVSEIVNLRWRNVQPNGDSGQITVLGKGDKVRAIKLSKDTWAVLVQFMPPGATLVDFVFQSQRRKGQERRNGQLDRTAVNKIVSNAGKLIDVPKLSPHWFRHAHASHALEKGATVAVVKETLGHSNLATTSSYLHAKPNDSSALYLGV